MRKALATGLMALAGCSDGRPPTGGTPPLASPQANRPPTVVVRGGGACHPSPGRPCTVIFEAEASDPDGDAVTLTWTGCAAGTGGRATCVVTSPETHTTRVEANDGRGGSASATGTAEGTNRPPRVRFGSPRPPDPAPANTLFFLAGGQPEDPDFDEDSNEICRSRTKLTVSGPCRAGLASCGGVGDVFDVDIRTLTGPGTCVIEAEARDSWDAVGSDRLEFRVSR